MRKKKSAASPGSDRLFGPHAALLSPYDLEVMQHVVRLGGFYVAHEHLCRIDTLSSAFLSHIGTTPIDASRLPLSVKQNLVGDYHRGIGYTEESLRERMRAGILRQIAYGTRRIDTNIDATPDLPEDGLLAIRVANELKEEFAGKLELRIAPTPIFGFKADPHYKLGRWEVFHAASRHSDYLSLLPEKDDFSNEKDRDGKIGFKHHIRRGIELACELGKEVQFHLDQMNIPGERGTERLLEMIEGLDLPVIPGYGNMPTVWVVHMISPSAYDEERFARLVDGLLKFNIGVIVCPSAALSMRQLRSLNGPIHNSIARVLELIKMKVPLRMGPDNIADVFVPASDGDMLTEIKMAAQATRLYNPSIWAKLACGEPLNNVDIATVGQILYEDRKACIGVNPNWKPAIE